MRIVTLAMFIIVTMLSPLNAQVNAQEAAVQEPAQVFTHENPMPELPTIEVTIPEIIDVLTEYKVIHMDNPVFCRDFYGLTDYFTKTIIICAYDLTSRRRTLFHELLHVIYQKRGIGTSGFREGAVDAMATELFHKYYGIPTVISAAPISESKQ